MAVKQKTLEHYLAQLRKIEEHREQYCEQNVRAYYSRLDKDLKEFLGVQYAELAENDQLTYEILHKKGQYARFIEEVEQRINTFTPKAAQEIKNTVQLTYKKCFEGMIDAVEKSKDYKELKVNLKGVRAVTPDVVKNVVKNSFLEDALEKNHKANIYNIKQQIGVGLTQGDRMSTMAKRISEQINSDYKKSIRIARTECHRVREAGFQDSSQRIAEKLDDDYVMTKTWKTMKDLSVRPWRRKGKKGFFKGKGPDHVSMEGVTVLVDEPFDLGDGNKAIAPGQSGVAGHDINCRCHLSRDLMTKAEFEKLTGKKIESKPVIKPKEDEILETQEQALLDEKNNLEKEKEKYIKRQQNLETYQYDGIWKESVTPADYEVKKDKIQAKRDYYNQDILDAKNRTGKYANTNFYSDNDLNAIIAKHQKYLDDLDNFEVQGKKYLELSKKLKKLDTDIIDIDDEVKAVRVQIMKVKGIDPKKIQSEIDDLTEKINQMKNVSVTVDKDALKKITWQFEDGWTYHTDPNSKFYVDDKLNVLKNKKAAGVITPKMQQDLDDLEEFLDKYKKLTTSNADPKQLAKLQKQLKDKQDELNKVMKRYGLEDDKFSQKRKDAAYWFTDKNGSVAGADNILRDKSGEVWKAATKAQKDATFGYTSSYHKYNEPLRGYEYGTSKFLGVGNVDLDDIGVSYSGYKKGQVKKLIDDMTDTIDKSTYDFDIWLNRGVRRSGMDKFFGIDISDFDLSEKELAAKLLGTTPTEYGFMSTGVAKGKGFGGEIKLNIYAPKGTKMIYTEPFSSFGNGDGRNWDGIRKQSSFGYEAEMILQRNTKFRVIKVEKSGGTWYIDMEVIGQKR